MKTTGLLLLLGINGLGLVSCNYNKTETGAANSAVADSMPDSVNNRAPVQLNSELDDPERDVWQKPDAVIAEFGNVESKKIADIGAGTGYFSFRMAAKGATVLAIDIDSNFLEHIAKASLDMGSALPGKIITRISKPDSPSLNENEVDGVLIVNTASFLPDREAYFREAYQSIKPGGKMVIVDFKAERSPVTPSEGLLISSAKLGAELTRAGFRNVQVKSELLPYQYIITGVKP